MKTIKQLMIRLKEENIDKWNAVFISEILIVVLLVLLEENFAISFVCIMIHEFSHIILAKINGIKISNLKVHIYGAKVDLFDVDELTFEEKLSIYIVGPLANFFIAVLIIMINSYLPNSLGEKIITINLGLAMFNLLPAYPLDGARILEVLLSSKILFKKAREIISCISYFIAGVFIVLFILLLIIFKNFNISLLLIGLIVIYITNIEKRTVIYILMGNIYKKQKKLIKNDYIETRTLAVNYKIGLVKLMTIVDKNRFNIFYVLDDDLKVLFIMREDELIEALKKYGNMSLEEYYGKRD